MPGNDLTLEEIEHIVAQSAWKPPEYYVYFQPETGEIKSISNYLVEHDNNFIKVTPAEVYDLLTGKETVSDYTVIMDFKINEYILQNITQEGPRSFNWSDEVYQIPVSTEHKELTIIQDKKNGTWTLEINENIKKILSKQNTLANHNLSFYATKIDDVNVLFGILKFPVRKILSTGSYTITDQSAIMDSSVYCRKVFDFYSHKIS
jgi:hypothetical protein